MKKALALATVLVMLVPAAAGLAETPVRLVYDSLFSLLFETNNVTLTGHAEFSLDGERFKTADALYIQDGSNSLWQWKLLTPRPDGPEREGGYTVIANGGTVYVMEAFYPGVYKTGTTEESFTILRESVQLSLLGELIRILADQSEDLLGKDAVQIRSDETGMTVRLQTGKDVPEIVNTALNMAVQFVAKRYFDTDYDFVSERFMGTMGNYLTVTQGILGSTYYLSLKQADITLKRDAGGDFESAEGNVSFELNTANDGIRILDISFRLDVSDRGGSKVKIFNPADYGVKLAEGAMKPVNPETGPLDPETEKRILEEAVARWHLAGYTVDDSMTGDVVMEGSTPEHEDVRIHVDFMNGDGSAYWSYFTDSIGRMLGLQNMTNPWQGTTVEWYSGEYPDGELVKETEERLLSWLAEENPELSADVLSLETDGWYQDGETVYLHFREGESPASHEWDEADFIVRAAPEWRIEFFSCIGNG